MAVKPNKAHAEFLCPIHLWYSNKNSGKTTMGIYLFHFFTVSYQYVLLTTILIAKFIVSELMELYLGRLLGAQW